MKIPLDERGNAYYKKILPARADISRKLEGERLNTDVTGTELYDMHQSIIDDLDKAYDEALENAVTKLLETR